MGRVLKRLRVLFVPGSIVGSVALAIVGFFVFGWCWYQSLYLLLIACVFLYTAIQSLTIQTMFTPELDSLSDDEQAELGNTVARDYFVFSLVHAGLFSLAYWGVVWLFLVL